MLKKFIALTLVFLITLHVIPLNAGRAFANNAYLKQENNQVFELSEQLVEHKIGGKESHSYYINLMEGQFIYLDIVQLGVDVAVYLQGDSVDVKSNTPFLIYEPEPFYWIAEKTGKYTVTIKPVDEKAEAGKYAIKIGEIRISKPEDMEYIKGQEKFIEAERLRNQNTKESLLSAITYYTQSCEHWKKVEKKERQAVCLNIIGETFFILEDLKSARIFVEKSLEMFPLGSGLAQAFVNLGHICYALSDSTIGIEKIIGYFSEGLKINEQINDKNIKVNALNGLGNIYLILNHKDEAFAAYSEVIKVSRQINNLLEEAVALYNIGVILRDVGEHQKALIFLNEALVLFEKANSPLGQRVSVLHEIALNNSFLKNFDLALKTYGVLMDIATKNNLNGLRIRTLIGKGFTQHLQGEYQKSLLTYQEALGLNVSFKNSSYESIITREIGLAHFLLGDNGEALSNYNKAYQVVSKSVNNKELHLRNILYRRAELYRKLGDLELAIKDVEEAINIVENFREKTFEIGLKTLELVEGNKIYELYVDLLMMQHGKDPTQGYDAKALYFYELSKARGLLDLITESGIDIRKGVDNNLTNKELELQALINKKNSVLRDATLEEEKVKLAKEVNVLKLDLQQVEVAIKKANPFYSQIKRAKALTLEEIQKNVLDEDTLLVEYSLGKWGNYVWVITNKTLNTYQLSSRTEIQKLSEPVKTYFKTQFRRVENESVKNERERIAQEKFFGKALRDFSEIILGTISNHLTKKKIIFVANESLQSIPFAALLKANPKNKQESYPLIMDHEIISMPSISTLGVLKEQSSKAELPTKSIVIIADPVLTSSDNRIAIKSKENAEIAKINQIDRKKEVTLGKRLVERSDFDPLPFVGQEVQAIEKVYSKESPKILSGLDASLSNVFNPEIGEYGVLHFATHGFIDKLQPELSGLVLSLYDENGTKQDGYLTSANIFKFNLKADLVVLSACQTGGGKDLKGEGIVGLSRAFFCAGAKKVLFTFWNINDESTSVLMSRFYSNMKKDGLKPAAALRQAQISMYKDKKWSAPYYWAAFQLQGDF